MKSYSEREEKGGVEGGGVEGGDNRNSLHLSDAAAAARASQLFTHLILMNADVCY